VTGALGCGAILSVALIFWGSGGTLWHASDGSIYLFAFAGRAALLRGLRKSSPSFSSWAKAQSAVHTIDPQTP
jgi:hypothetical protein